MAHNSRSGGQAGGGSTVIPGSPSPSGSSSTMNVRGYRLALLPNGYTRVDSPSGLVALVSTTGNRSSVPLPRDILTTARGMAVR